MSNPGRKGFQSFKSEAAKARYIAAYDAVLKNWPVVFEAFHIPTRVGMTHVIASGPPDAPPLILLHAMCATATMWRPNVEELSRHFRVYAVDVIGQPGKSVATRMVGKRRDFTNWMCDLLNSLGITRTHIAGSSYGAFLALSQASLAPDRVDRVVLINPGGTFVSFLPKVFAMFAITALHALRILKKPQRPNVGLFLGRNVVLNPEDRDWEALASVLLADMPRISAAFPTVFSKTELRSIRRPTLLLMGDNERLYDPHKTLLLAQARMPLLEAQIIAGAHHLASMAKPAEVNAKIIQFLQRT